MFSINMKEKIWKNWSHSVLASPKTIARPKDLNDLLALVQACQEKGRKIRVVGAGHSFTPLVATSEVLVSLDNLSGIVEVDDTNSVITVWAGTRLRDLGPLLEKYGYALENMGDTDAQSIAGAVSTGTHGTGRDFKSLSNQVVGLTILTAKGELVEINLDENPAYLDAARLSLGLLGIIVTLRLKVVKAYSLMERSFQLDFHQALGQLAALNEANRNFEFFWFPYTERMQVKTLNIVNLGKERSVEKKSWKKLLLENGLFWFLSEVSRRIPSLAPNISKVSAWGIPTGEQRNISYRQYVSPRYVKFNEMEYSLPQEAMAEALRDIEKLLTRKRIAVHFPLECRYVKADDIWLSPAYQRDSAFIAVHMYKGMDFKEYFNELEEIFLGYEGRAHWGKMHSQTTSQLLAAYPKLDDFLEVRKQFDPDAMFVNDYLSHLLGIGT